MKEQPVTYVWKQIPRKRNSWNVRLSNMYSATGFMQNALPVLHNALRLPSLRNANHLKLMESIQVDGILPRAWLWNICDSSNVIDAAKGRWIQVGRTRGERRREDMKEWNEYKVCLVEYNTSCYWLSLPLLLNKGWKILCTAMCTLLNELKEAILQGNIWFMQGTILVLFRSFFGYKMPSHTKKKVTWALVGF